MMKNMKLRHKVILPIAAIFLLTTVSIVLALEIL